jgi:hypothetical protein
MNEDIKKCSIRTDTSNVEKKVINGMEFVSLKMEKYRYYTFPVGVVRIGNPQWLFVRPSGAHQVIDLSGECHYIPNTFIKLSWLNREAHEEAEF